MRWLAAFAAVLALAGCATTAPRRPRPRLVVTAAHRAHARVGVCASSDCGSYSVTLSWGSIPASFSPTGYYVTVNGTQVADVPGSGYTVTGMDCGTVFTLGVQAHDNASHTSQVLTVQNATPVCGCTFYASPTGVSTNTGSQASPYDLASLVTHLAADQEGCLLSGTYGATPVGSGSTASTGTHWVFTSSGSAAANVVITAAPGDATVPTVEGYIQLGDGNSNGNYLTFSHLNLDVSNTFGDGCASQSSFTFNGSTVAQGTTVPTDCMYDTDYHCPNATLTTGRYFPEALVINGNGDVLDHDDIFTSIAQRSVLAGVGFQQGTINPGTFATNDRISYSRLHDSGGCGTQHDHAIYVDYALDFQFDHNWVYGAIDGQTINLYQSSIGARIRDNVVDSSSAPFNIAGATSGESNHNTFDHNVATAVQNYVFDDGSSAGVHVLECFQAGATNTMDSTDWFSAGATFGSCTGMTPTNTLNTDPLYVNAAAHDYTVQASALAGWGLPSLSQIGPSGH